MTRNRARKDMIRARQKATGTSYAQSARHTMLRRPIGDLLREATEDMIAVDASDTAAVLKSAWTALCIIGAAGELLSICAEAEHYPLRWRLTEPVLSDAVHALRAAPALRGKSSEIDPAGGPDKNLDDRAADLIRRHLVETAEALSATLSRAAPQEKSKASRRACRVGAAAARRVVEVYRPDGVAQPLHPRAAAHPERLPAYTLGDFQQVIDDQLHQLEIADPADTTAALTSAWYGFAVSIILGQYLAHRDPDYEMAHKNAAPVIVQILRSLEAAPSLARDVHGVGLDTVPETSPELMRLARDGIWELTLAINALLPKVAEGAAHEADRRAARLGTMLAAELNGCYEGRLRTYLNLYGRPLGSSSTVVRGKGKSRKRNDPGPGSEGL